MGKVQIITENQKIILGEIKNNAWLKRSFYLSGGTALSAFYLQHRYSNDLDFFSKEKFDNEIIFSLMGEWGKNHGFSFQSRFVEVVYKFNLEFKGSQSLTIDFAYYPYGQLGEELNFEGIRIDSLFDIAVNKMLIIGQRTDVKDFVDLYFLLQKFSVGDLMEGVKKKFMMEQEPLLLAADLLKIEDFDFLPRMVKPLNLEQLKNFFREKARELGSKSINKR